MPRDTRTAATQLAAAHRNPNTTEAAKTAASLAYNQANTHRIVQASLAGKRGGEPMLSKAEADVLAFAVRYALARHTTTASDPVVSEVVRLWPRLATWQQDQIKREIVCCAPNYAEEWDQVLDLPDSELQVAQGLPV